MDGKLLLEFNSRVDAVESYWRHLTIAAQLADFGGTTEPELVALISDLAKSVSPGLRKTFDYSSTVISLYGCVEDYVERLIEHCVEVVEHSTSNYSSLP